MPSISFRQPLARRAAEITLAGAVALSVIVVPGLFRTNGGKNVEAAAAGAPAPESTTTETPTTDVPTTEVATPPAPTPLPADDPLSVISLAYASASPEMRAALDQFFAPAPPPAPEPTPAPRPQAPAASAPSVSGGSVWDSLATCESHNDWTTHTASGFSGGLQFADATWRSFGGTAYAPQAWQASREAQIAVAERVLASSGWGAWPACSRKLGLR
jgi:hypothetical protein